ncbi:hypothetical protein [Streptomyces gilvus]|nr:hypothetical protein [Streptomyces sp. CME 23]
MSVHPVTAARVRRRPATGHSRANCARAKAATGRQGTAPSATA